MDTQPGGKLLHKRCFNHAEREATARCPVCTRDFCRECVTEHDHRMLCRSCQAATEDKKKIRTGHWGKIWQIVFFLLALFAIFMCFNFFARLLAGGAVNTPSRLHVLEKKAR